MEVSWHGGTPVLILVGFSLINQAFLGYPHGNLMALSQGGHGAFPHGSRSELSTFAMSTALKISRTLLAGVPTEQHQNTGLIVHLRYMMLYGWEIWTMGIEQGNRWTTQGIFQHATFDLLHVSVVKSLLWERRRGSETQHVTPEGSQQLNPLPWPCLKIRKTDP